MLRTSCALCWIILLLNDAAADERIKRKIVDTGNAEQLQLQTGKSTNSRSVTIESSDSKPADPSSENDVENDFKALQNNIQSDSKNEMRFNPLPDPQHLVNQRDNAVQEAVLNYVPANHKPVQEELYDLQAKDSSYNYTKELYGNRANSYRNKLRSGNQEAENGDKKKSRYKTSNRPKAADIRYNQEASNIRENDVAYDIPQWKQLSENVEMSQSISGSTLDDSETATTDYGKPKKLQKKQKSRGDHFSNMHQNALYVATNFAEGRIPLGETENFNHGQVLQQSNKFDFSDAMSPADESRANERPLKLPQVSNFFPGHNFARPLNLKPENFVSREPVVPGNQQAYQYLNQVEQYKVLPPYTLKPEGLAVAPVSTANSNRINPKFVYNPYLPNLGFFPKGYLRSIEFENQEGKRVVPAIIIPLTQDLLHQAGNINSPHVIRDENVHSYLQNSAAGNGFQNLGTGNFQNLAVPNGNFQNVPSNFQSQSPQLQNLHFHHFPVKQRIQHSFPYPIVNPFSANSQSTPAIQTIQQENGSDEIKNYGKFGQDQKFVVSSFPHQRAPLADFNRQQTAFSSNTLHYVQPVSPSQMNLGKYANQPLLATEMPRNQFVATLVNKEFRIKPTTESGTSLSKSILNLLSRRSANESEFDKSDKKEN